MKVLLLDHAFHKATGSSGFFVALLRQRFVVDHRFIDAESPDADPVFREDLTHDIVVLWQFDYLAPLFMARGMRTVVVPMYDGSANMPRPHWQAAQGARFVNFSRTLHERVLAAGGASLHVRYFPRPVDEREIVDLPDVGAFFWQRRPRELPARVVTQMLGTSLRALHIHCASDIAGEQAPIDPASLGVPGLTVTQSSWFDTQARYLDQLRRCNVYVAPRISEGIGFAFLEAMARGMCVIASDQPTHTEYIANWISGVLFNPYQPPQVALGVDQVRVIGRMAWQSVRIGREQWEAEEPALLDWIASTPRPPAASPLRREPAFAASLCSAYLAGGSAYPDFLLRHGLALTAQVGADVPGGDSGEVPPADASMPFADAQPDGLVFGTGGPAVQRLHGFAASDVYSSALTGPRAAFAFGVRHAPRGAELVLEGEAESTPALVLTLACGTAGVQSFRIDAGARRFELTLTLDEALAGLARVDLRLQRADTLQRWDGVGQIRFARLRLARAEPGAAP